MMHGETAKILNECCIKAFDVKRALNYADQCYEPYVKGYKEKTKGYLTLAKGRIKELSELINKAEKLLEEES